MLKIAKTIDTVGIARSENNETQ